MIEIKCVLCGDQNLKLFHSGLRDRSDIDMLECSKCGLLQVSELGDFTVEKYEEGGMHKSAYNAESDTIKEQTYWEWREQAKEDDIRRANFLHNICKDKSILDFGCGSRRFRGIK
ncbi:MAG: hypothetical protein R3Y54_11830 [Eubacteriales bacterium]